MAAGHDQIYVAEGSYNLYLEEEAFNQAELHFTDQTPGSPTTWQWKLGSAIFSAEQNPILINLEEYMDQLVYPPEGLPYFIVTLTTDVGGARSYNMTVVFVTES